MSRLILRTIPEKSRRRPRTPGRVPGRLLTHRTGEHNWRPTHGQKTSGADLWRRLLYRLSGSGRVRGRFHRWPLHTDDVGRDPQSTGVASIAHRHRLTPRVCAPTQRHGSYDLQTMVVTHRARMGRAKHLRSRL